MSNKMETKDIITSSFVALGISIILFKFYKYSKKMFRNISFENVKKESKIHMEKIIETQNLDNIIIKKDGEDGDVCEYKKFDCEDDDEETDFVHIDM